MHAFLSRLFARPHRSSGFVLAFHSINHSRHISQIEKPAIVTDTDSFKRILDDACRIAEPTAVANENRSAKWFSVTFDDGFRDVMTSAIPILEERKIPATVFVTKGFATRDVLPYEIAIGRSLSDGHNEEAQNSDWRESLERQYAQIRLPLRNGGKADRDEFLGRLDLNIDQVHNIADLFLDCGEIAAASQHPLLTIGSHGISHTCLSAQRNSVVDSELADSKSWIETLTQVPCSMFAFPYGDYDDRSTRRAKAAGYDHVFTTIPAHIAGKLPQIVPRFVCDGNESLPRGCVNRASQ